MSNFRIFLVSDLGIAFSLRWQGKSSRIVWKSHGLNKQIHCTDLQSKGQRTLQNIAWTNKESWNGSISNVTQYRRIMQLKIKLIQRSHTISLWIDCTLCLIVPLSPRPVLKLLYGIRNEQIREKLNVTKIYQEMP